MHLLICVLMRSFNTSVRKCRPERLRLSDKSVDGEYSFQFDRCEKVGRSPWACLLAAVRIHPFIFLYQIGPPDFLG